MNKLGKLFCAYFGHWWGNMILNVWQDTEERCLVRLKIESECKICREVGEVFNCQYKIEVIEKALK